jgi:putative ABC transport system permease protein
MRLAALAWRGLAARRLRTALTVLGVALGVALVAGTLIANQAANETVRRAAGELFGKAELRVRAFASDGFTPRAVTTLRRLPGVTAAAPVGERQLTVSTMPHPEDRSKEHVFNLLVLGVDPLDEAQVRTYALTAGSMLAADSPRDALVNAAWAAQYGLGVGDQLILTGHRVGQDPLRIVGLLDDVGFGSLAQGSVLVMNRDALDATFEIPSPVTAVDLVVAPGHLDDVQTALDKEMTEPFIVETVAVAEQQLSRAQAGFAGIAFLFALVALAVGAFLVANAQAMTIGERTREIGLLRAAGATRGQVLALFLRQGLMIGSIGSALGVAGGIVMAALMIGILRSTRAVLVAGLPLNALSLLLAFAIGLAVTLAAAALPAVAASRVSPLDALRPSRQPGRSLWQRVRWLLVIELLVLTIGVGLYPLNRGDGALSSVPLVLAVLLAGWLATTALLQPVARLIGRPFEWFFGAQGMLGRANIGRDRARTGLTVGALILALAAVVALGSVAASARASAERWVGSIIPGGYAIRLGLAVDIEANRADFEATSGAKAATPIVEFPAVAREAANQTEVSLAGIDPTVYESAGSLIFVDGTRALAFQELRDGGAVLVPQSAAERDGLKVGEAINLGVPGAKAQPYVIAGVIAYTLPARSPDGAFLISLADAADQFKVTKASLWAFVPQDGITAAAFRAAVNAKARDYAAEPLTAADLANNVGRSLDRLLGLFDVLALLAVVIAGLGVVNTLAVGVSERSREIAILRSHGMTTGQVQAMVVSEAGIMGAVGGIAAVGTGLLVAWAIVGATSARDFGAGLAIPWPLLISVVMLGTAIASLASLYPARLAARTSIVRSVQHFE